MDLRAILCVIFIIEISVACDTNKLLFGSINESFPLQVEKNGIYIKQADEYDGYPVWKHESRDLYIYHVSGSILQTAFWVIGDSIGSLSVNISVQTKAKSPELVEENWRIYSKENRLWKPQRHLAAVCKEETFGLCESGRVRLHSLSPWNHHQHGRTGVYFITDQVHQNRPVYQHKHKGDFLYYVDGLWMIGPEVGRVSAAIFVLDYAWQPEFIIDTWIVFDGQHFMRDTRLRLDCVGQPSVNPLLPPHHDPISTSDIINVAEGILSEEENEAVIPVCDVNTCQNGGQCIKGADGASLCACTDGYTGDTCEQAVTCGPAPNISHAILIGQTGERFHDHAFYSCVDEFVMVTRESAAICETSGQWERLPTCIHLLDYLNPGVPGTAPSRRGRPPTHRRSQRNHRRNRRSALPVTFEQMKAMFD